MYRIGKLVNIKFQHGTTVLLMSQLLFFNVCIIRLILQKLFNMNYLIYFAVTNRLLLFNVFAVEKA